MSSMTAVRARAIEQMEMTCAVLGNLLQIIPAEQTNTLRDGPDGWTVLQVVCHLRDFDQIFSERVEQALAEDNPRFPAYDPDQLAAERNYGGEDLATVYGALRSSRQRLVERFKGLTEEQWERAGIHPRRGHTTLTDVAAGVSFHDTLHTEQITRIVAQG